MARINPYVLAALDDRRHRDDRMDSRFRDRDGREHYDNGRFAPQSAMDRDRGDWSRRDYGTAHWYPSYPTVPPIYRDSPDMRWDDDRPMGKIGFSAEGEIGHPWEMGGGYRADIAHHSGDEMAYRTGKRSNGYAAGDMHRPLTREAAEAWVASMKNADGSTGPHWTMEQTKQIQAQKGIGLDPVKFWVAMNMMFSDYATAAEKVGASTTDFYADMAKAFLIDKDAMPDKLDRYYCAIVKH